MAACHLSFGGTIPARRGSRNTGVSLRHPEIIYKELLITTSTLLAWELLHQTGVQYSVVEKARACVEIVSILAEAPQVLSARQWMSATLVVTFDFKVSKGCLKDSILLNLTPRQVGVAWKEGEEFVIY